MTGNAAAGRDAITKSPAEAGRSFTYMKVSGAATATRSQDCLREDRLAGQRRKYAQMGERVE